MSQQAVEVGFLPQPLPEKPTAQEPAVTETGGIRGALLAELAGMSLPERARALASGLGCVAVSAVGVTRTPSVLAMSVPLAVMEHTHLPPLAGAATAAAYGAWCFMDAHVFNAAVDQLPRTFRAVGRRMPTARMDGLLPGLSPERPPAVPSVTEEQTKRLGSRAVALAKAVPQELPLRLRRGVAIQGAGNVSYVVGAAMQEQTRAERRRLSNNLGLDGAILMGSVATAATSAIYFVGTQNSAAAEQIMHASGNRWLWLGVAFGLPAIQAVSKQVAARFRRRFGTARQITDSETVS